MSAAVAEPWRGRRGREADAAFPRGTRGPPLARADPLTGSPWKNREFRESPGLSPVSFCVPELVGALPGERVLRTGKV